MARRRTTSAGRRASSPCTYRSHISFVLGDAFVPEDTSGRWVLFAEYIPELRERIMAETGYWMPGFNVRADRFGSADNVVHLLLHDVILETYHLPTDGEVVRYRPRDLPEAELRDPESGDPVQHIPPGEPEPAGAVERWLPLQFVMRHVEQFVRSYLADIVTVWDAVDLAEEAGPEVVVRLSDPPVFRRWLSEARQDIVHGGARDPGTRGRAIAERLRQATT